MLFVKTDELKPGMRLAKPIYNRLGVMLYDRNTSLTPQGIKSIQKFSLIGIYILEPAEPAPPLSEEEIHFEQFQTIYMFRLRDELDKIANEKVPDKLHDLAANILKEYGSLNHKIHFSQNIRSSGDFVYKHGLSVASLCAMLSHKLDFIYEDQLALVQAALLYDNAYLYLETNQLEHISDSSSEFYAQLCAARDKANRLLNPEFNPYHLPQLTLNVLAEMALPSNHKDHPMVNDHGWLLSTQVLRVADRFDQMTAMQYGIEPRSEVLTIRYLVEYPEYYSPTVVNALAECIHILPQGACVDLSTGEQGMVLESNPINFLEPLILKFSNNTVYDLSDPHVQEHLKIQDIMKTMDNRISIDEKTLKHFQADAHIIEITKRFKEKKAKRSGLH